MMIKSKVWLLALIVIASVLHSQSSFAPYERGNGSDRYDWLRDSAWFINPSKPVKACIEVSDDFGVEDAQVISTVQSALKTWEKYYVSHRVPAARRSSLQYEIQETCNGDEDIT